MARINSDKKWYEQVEPSTFSEGEFEERVAVHAPSVYPFYHVLPFKKRVKAPDPTRESGYCEVVPDLVFIAKDYSSWWIVEVEMDDHSFDSHVGPQVENLLNAEYGDSEVDYLLKKYNFLVAENLSDLIKTGFRRVMIIVNQKKPDWIKREKKGKFVIAVFELYRSSDNDEIFRVNGSYPSILGEKVSTCSLHPILPRLLKVEEPDKLEIPKNGIVSLLYNNCVTEWHRIDESREVFLTARHKDFLQPRMKYSIFRQNDGQFVLVQDYPL